MGRKEANGSSTREILSGIRLVLEEIRDLKREIAEERRKSDERRAEEHRETMAQLADMRREFRDSLDEFRREAAADRKDFNRTLTAILKVGREFRAEQKKQTAILHRHARILEDIARSVRVRGNGSHGNGGKA